MNAALILISVSPFQDRNALLRSQLHLLTINEKINAEVVAETQPGLRNDETKSEIIAMFQFLGGRFFVFSLPSFFWFMNAKMPISSDIPMIMMIVLDGMNKDFSIYSPGKKNVQ